MEKALQRDDIDPDLRNALWTVYHATILEKNQPYTAGEHAVSELRTSLWVWFFKQPIDAMWPAHRFDGELRQHFFTCKWHEVYDLIEFTAKHAGVLASEFMKLTNRFLEHERSAYRLVGEEIVEITDQTEIETIESALGAGLRAVKAHLETAISLLNDRKKPDYRNSIKESISAVEAACRLLSGDEKATLGGALKTLSSKAPLHPAFEKALSSMYGFTNDEAGIRHSLLDAPRIGFSDAKFMLVTSSAFVLYLLARAAEEGIEIK